MNKIIQSIKYLTILTIFGYLLSLLRISILARLLSPSVFGIFSLAVILDKALQSLTSVGTEKYLIQKNEITNELIGGVWYFNIIRGIVICVLLIATGSFYSRIVNDPSVFPVLVIISFASFFRGMVSPGTFLLERNIKYKKIAIYEFCVSCVDVFAVVVFALIFKNVKALAWGIVATSVFRACLSFIIFPIRFTPRIQLSIFKELIGIGKHFIILGIGSFIMMQSDKLIIGTICGSDALGLYSVAIRLTQMPLNILRKIVNRIALPVFSRLQFQKEQLRNTTMKVIKIQMAILIPIIIFLLSSAEPLVLIICGEEWIDAVPIVKALVLVVLGKGLAHVVVPYIMGTGNYSFISKIKIVEVVIFVIGVIVGIYYYNVVGAALGAGFGYLVAALFRLIFLCKHSKIDVKEICIIMLIPAICMVPGFFINYYVINFYSFIQTYNLLIILFIYLMTYFIGSCFFQKDIVQYFKQLSPFNE